MSYRRRYRGYAAYGNESVIPVVGDVMQNASPNDRVHPDEPSASDRDIGADLDALAVSAGGQFQAVVAQAKPSMVGWVALAVGAWLLLG